MKRRSLQIAALILLALSPSPLWAGEGGVSEDKVAPGLRRVMDDLAALQDNQTEVPVILRVSSGFFNERANPLGLSQPKALKSIDGYATRLPLSALRGLLNSPILEYATLDLPLAAASAGRRVADDFDFGTGYSGQDGTEAWLGDWLEGGEKDGPGAGLIQVVPEPTYCASGSCLYLGAYNQTSGGPWTLSRRADLSDAASATLSYNLGYLPRSNEGFLKVQVRRGGGDWKTLKTYSINSLKMPIRRLAESFDISVYAGADTEIRFWMHRTDASYTTSDEVEGYFYIDNLRIEVATKSDAAASPGVVEFNWNSSSYMAAIGLEQHYQPQLGVRNAIGVNGAGVGVAVFDSGAASHPDLAPFGGSVEVDFTSALPVVRTVPVDGHGHGTHVSGIIAGRGFQSAGEIAGVAPMANLIHLKVIGDDGSGLTSSLILAIEWAIANKNAYGIRVANLSLGHPAVESYEKDPLCRAVRSLVEAGIVTVVSAGNLGRTAKYPEIWGAITSPGNEPTVITVGAVNTRGTATHADDVATTYSSRGFTSFDHSFKPDLAAPGNSIPSTAAAGSLLQSIHPAPGPNPDYMTLSGSSMAAAFVSGVAALMLEANPSLTPNLVKAALVASAVKMPDAHILEQGNGFLNAYTAVRLAQRLNVAGQSVTGPVDPAWTLISETGSEPVRAGGAFVYGDRVFYSSLASPMADLWGTGYVWSQPDSTFEATLWAEEIFSPKAVFWSPSVFTAGGLVWLNGGDWAGTGLWNESFVWGEGLIWGEGLVWAEGLIWAEGLLWTEGVMWVEGLLWSEGHAFLGPD